MDDYFNFQSRHQWLRYKIRKCIEINIYVWSNKCTATFEMIQEVCQYIIYMLKLQKPLLVVTLSFSTSLIRQ